MEIMIAAIHEAGHSVMQWFVGWEPRGLHMTIKDSQAIDPYSTCPTPDLRPLSAIRRRLLVLLSGQQATIRQWPNSLNNFGDLRDMMYAFDAYFGSPTPRISMDFRSGFKFSMQQANEMHLEASERCCEIVDHPRIRDAIDEVANRFSNLSPDVDGRVHMSELEVVEICRTVIGDEFRSDNPWSNWMSENACC